MCKLENWSGHFLFNFFNIYNYVITIYKYINISTQINPLNKYNINMFKGIGDLVLV